MDNTAATTLEEQRRSLLPTALIAAAFLVVAVVFCASSNWYATFKAVHVGFASTFVTGVAVLGPRSHRVDELIRTVGVEAAETQAAIRQLLLIARFDVAVLLLVIVDMVVKPFST